MTAPLPAPHAYRLAALAHEMSDLLQRHGPGTVNGPLAPYLEGFTAWHKYETYDDWSIRPGGIPQHRDVTVDASGRVCLNEHDMARAAYPVWVMRPRQLVR